MDATSLSATTGEPDPTVPLVDDDRLALIARSDVNAFAALYARHRERVFRYLRARCRNDDDALDLTAGTFERALAAIARYRPSGAGFAAWLLRIARNAAIDHDRRLRARPAPVPLREAEGASAGDDPLVAAIASDESRRLRELVRMLAETERDALALRYSAGLTAREIGAVVGKSEEATQKIISRALAELREAYRRDPR
ncbi:MAG TPA: sigma-70 family RNA polymerase sigma factor [Candidatus Bathyarchaeia archaeon]|nr:sigma-70 family RNA polymerase sigma factor [Candidatus Bathyarchaeia archaeon]